MSLSTTLCLVLSVAFRNVSFQVHLSVPVLRDTGAKMILMDTGQAARKWGRCAEARPPRGHLEATPRAGGDSTPHVRL